MIVECKNCESKVDSIVLYSGPDSGRLLKISLAKCPICESPLVVGQTYLQTGPDTSEWVDTKRLWPEPNDYLHPSIPPQVRDSLLEAQKCYRAKAFMACVVMCGRTIEAICCPHTQEENLSRGLKALKEKGIIDGRLFEWGDSLRQERNIGAHATRIKTSREDAGFALDFATAICEYVFVLSAKYNAYQMRKKKSRKE